jgi:hypothetical protein
MATNITALDLNEDTLHQINVRSFINFIPCSCGLEHCRCNNGTCICSSGDEDKENTRIMDLNGIRVSAEYFEEINTVVFANASGCSFHLEKSIIPMLQFIYKQQQQHQHGIKFDKSLEYNILKSNLITSVSSTSASSTSTSASKNINIYIDTQSFCYSGPDFGQSRRGLRPIYLLNPYTMKNVNFVEGEVLIAYSINFVNDINTVVISNASSKSYSYKETSYIIDVLGNKLNVKPSHIADAKRVLQICENTSYEIECNPDCHCLQPHPSSINCDTLTSSQYADAEIYCDDTCEFPCRGRGEALALPHPVSPEEMPL